MNSEITFIPLYSIKEYSVRKLFFLLFYHTYSFVCLFFDDYRLNVSLTLLHGYDSLGQIICFIFLIKSGSKYDAHMSYGDHRNRPSLTFKCNKIKEDHKVYFTSTLKNVIGTLNQLIKVTYEVETYLPC